MGNSTGQSANGLHLLGLTQLALKLLDLAHILGRMDNTGNLAILIQNRKGGDQKTFIHLRIKHLAAVSFFMLLRFERRAPDTGQFLPMKNFITMSADQLLPRHTQQFNRGTIDL